jgi:hypothetical protein
VLRRFVWDKQTAKRAERAKRSFSAELVGELDRLARDVGPEAGQELRIGGVERDAVQVQRHRRTLAIPDKAPS